MIVFKILIFTLFVPGAFLVLVPYLLLSSFGDRFGVDLGSIRYIGLIAMLFGLVVYVRCVWAFVSVGKGTPIPFDPPKTLVVRGLYRYMRNPMYVGVLSLIIGEAVFFRSLVLAFYAVMMFVWFHLFVVFYEEPTLRKKFGDSYKKYCSMVPRWIPKGKKQV